MTGTRRRESGEGGITQRKDGRWQAELVTGPSRKRRTVYGKTRREVALKLAELRRLRDRGEPHPHKRTVGDYLGSWLSDTLPGTVAPSTEASYKHLADRHLIPALGHIRLDALTPADVRLFIRRKSEEISPRTGKPLSARTVQYLHALLRTALAQAVRDELLVRNVAALVTPPRARREEVRPLSVDDARTLLRAAQPDRLHALFAVALAVGLRQGEALALHWSDIDLEQGTLRVGSTLQRRQRTRRQEGESKTELYIQPYPKTKRSRRTVPLPAVCLEALREHRRRQAAERLAAPVWIEPDLVFTTPLGTPVEPRSALRRFHELCDGAGLPRARFHDLRHTCASLLLAQGVEPRAIMETLGHSTIGTTLDLYAHVMPAMQRAAADQMDAVLG